MRADNRKKTWKFSCWTIKGTCRTFFEPLMGVVAPKTCNILTLFGGLMWISLLYMSISSITSIPDFVIYKTKTWKTWKIWGIIMPVYWPISILLILKDQSGIICDPTLDIGEVSQVDKQELIIPTRVTMTTLEFARPKTDLG